LRRDRRLAVFSSIGDQPARIALAGFSESTDASLDLGLAYFSP